MWWNNGPRDDIFVQEHAGELCARVSVTLPSLLYFVITWTDPHPQILPWKRTLDDEGNYTALVEASEEEGWASVVDYDWTWARAYPVIKELDHGRLISRASR